MKNRKSAQTERISFLEAMRVMERMRRAMVSPYRFFVVAAVLAALFTLLPTRADAPEQGEMLAAADANSAPLGDAQTPQPGGVPAGADLSERTQQGAYLHRTLTYACGHSVQRREALPAQLVGLSQAALRAQAEKEIPGGLITGFSAQEVDVAQRMDMPCPLHWVLRLGESGRIEVLRNTDGESLSAIRETEIARELLSEQALQELLDGVVFDDAQALEGYVESLSS